ncbi:MAG: hypothetical protein LBC61_06965 [Candidatus Peribacteria bacterium]|nr:hypothetical protein [Candidatus Peribacteria bacterium]
MDLYKDWVNYRTRSNKSFVFGFNFGGLKYDDTIPGLFATKGDMVLYDGTALKRVGL